ncbi:MAG: glutamate-5-semialdehyde dehydrogenase [Acetobacterales bacterium]
MSTVREIDHRQQAGDDIAAAMRALGEAARAAATVLSAAGTDRKDAALRAAAQALRAETPALLEANLRDLKAAAGAGHNAAFVDRLTLDPDRIEAMARGLEDIAELDDPVGRVLAEWHRPNGLDIARVSVPLGVIGVIYESRPNVTADAGGLCLKAGNASILRGGSDSAHSAAAIARCLHHGLKVAGLPETCIQVVPTSDRAAVGEMLRMAEYIDVIVPRGGKSLIRRISEESRIPMLKHLDGICHTYVDGGADMEMARRIAVNAKMRRPGVCGATETLLVDRRIAREFLPPVIGDLIEAGCAVRGDEAAQAADPRVTPATEEDWATEYLDAIIAVKVVDGVEAAVAHVNRYGSEHTDAIVTSDAAAAARFIDGVNSAIALHNASTQFADGGEFGMGAEIGIATGKLHARGPVGVEQLTIYKYVVRGTGQIRP